MEVTLLLAQTIDGYFYQPGAVPETQNIDFRAYFKKYRDSVDCLLITGDEYVEIYAECAEWPFDIPVYVTSGVDLNFKGKAPIEFIPSDHISFIENLKKNTDGRMGILPSEMSVSLIGSLLTNALVDEINLLTMPVLQAEGRKMIPSVKPSRWRVLESCLVAQDVSFFKYGKINL